jgi:hypothetical protein
MGITAQAAAPAAPVQVSVNEAPIAFRGQPPVEIGGRILVPLRGVMERLGAFVHYEQTARTVRAFRGPTNITLPVGSRRALIGDRAVTLDVPALIVNGATVVPLRFMAEALGARVTYDVVSRGVNIAVADDSGAASPPRTRRPPAGAPTGPVPSSSGVGAPLVTIGRVLAVYPNLVPRRIVVRGLRVNGVPVGNDGANDERTIPLRPNARVAMRRTKALLALPLERVRPGDTVEVRQTREGVATYVEIMASSSDAAAEAPPATPGDTKTPPDRGPGRRNVFRGEFLDSSPIKNRAYVLKMTDGRLIEVPADVLVLYGGQKIHVNDLRLGDALTISVDPKTRRGTRIVVAVEQRTGPSRNP